MVKNKFCFIILFLAFTLVSFGCNKGKRYINDFENPSDLNDWEEYETGLEGLSGLCYNRTKETFFAVTDKGKIYEISFQGKIIRELDFKGDNDFEAITINQKTGEIYLANERKMKVLKLSDDEKKLVEIVKIKIPEAILNKGLEGISYGNDTLYIANQTSPTRLFKYSLNTKELIYKDLLSFTFLSDISYDSTDNSLWIMDSKKQLLTHSDLNGNVIDTQKIPMVKKAETLIVDRKNKIIWIGCDKTGILYKINLRI